MIQANLTEYALSTRKEGKAQPIHNIYQYPTKLFFLFSHYNFPCNNANPARPRYLKHIHNPLSLIRIIIIPISVSIFFSLSFSNLVLFHPYLLDCIRTFKQPPDTRIRSILLCFGDGASKGGEEKTIHFLLFYH